MAQESDKFIGLKDVGSGKKCAVLRSQFYRFDGMGKATREMTFDAKSLRTRIANYKKAGLPVDQSEMVLRVLKATD